MLKLAILASYTIFDSIRQAKVEDLEVCIKRGSTINEIEKTRDKFTPLHCAAYHGSLEVNFLKFLGCFSSLGYSNHPRVVNIWRSSLILFDFSIDTLSFTISLYKYIIIDIIINKDHFYIM